MNSEPGNIIQTSDLSIGFKGRGEIFSRISVSAGPGELVALFGPNGIGKSTLLRNLAKLQSPLGGEIFISGKNLRSYSRPGLSRILGYVSTEIIHINNLRVRDLISLGRYPYTGWMGRLDQADHRKVGDAIDMVGIGHLENKFIHQLSDGERQRVMIARTLAQDTLIIVLDEPTAFLDLPNKYEIVHLLHKLASERKKTVIFSTHDLNIALQEAGKIWLMLDDRIIQGAPEDLILDGSFGRMFENTGLKFNRSRGDFRIRREHAIAIPVTGPETERKWTRNALEKIGFSVTESGPTEPSLAIVKSGDSIRWELTTGNRRLIYANIYELSNALKHLYPAGG
jgi:iron complex transport system ATP-binding protein